MQSEDDSCLPAGPLARERLILRATELREGGTHKMVGGWLTFGAGVVGVAAIAAARQCVLDCEPLSKARQAIVALSATAIIGGLIIAVVGHADRGLSRRLMERVRAAPLLSRGRVTGAALGLVLPF